jgi:hypothetical protein
MEEIRLDDRLTRPTVPMDPVRKTGDGDGPKAPDVKRPGAPGVMDRMKKVDPKTAERYRQRSGQ